MVLIPAVTLSVGLLLYFGVGIGQLVAETLTGTADQEPSPLWFLWISLPAYRLWGLGLGVAALSYARQTRRICRHCQQWIGVDSA